jgi:hypothetical protein
MVYFANSQHFTLCQTYFLAQQTRWSHVSYTCVVPHHEYARIDGVIYSTNPINSVGCSCLLHVCFLHASHVKDVMFYLRWTCHGLWCCHVLPYVRVPHYEYARQGYTNGGCPRLDIVHAAAWCIDTVYIVNGNVCGRFWRDDTEG